MPSRPERAHLAEQVGGAAAPRPTPAARAVGDLLLREVAAQPDEVALGLGEREVHPVIYWTERYKRR